MKDELGWKKMSEFVALRQKTCSYLTDEKKNKNRKTKYTKKSVIKQNFKLTKIMNLEATQIKNK